MIRTLIFLVVIFISLTSKKLQAQQSIIVTVENIVSDEGKMRYGLYNKTNFMKKPLQSVTAKINLQKSTVIFKNVPAGEYAIICYHDQNNNDKLDFSSQGIPLEDYGISNNKINPYGPPIYKDAKFTVDDNDCLVLK